MSNGFHDIMASASGRVRHLATRTRELIRDVMPNVVEVPWPKQRTIGYGVGPRKMSEHFCYIRVFKNHVSLGFYYGSELPDPEGPLRGTGKLLRHVKITKAEELFNPALRDLLELAGRHRMPERSST